jgi:large subunit ribosomal protein L6
MSRVGKKIIEIPQGVSVETAGKKVTVKGPKGQLAMTLVNGIALKQEGSTATLVIEEPGTDRSHGALHGTMRANLANMVKGVNEGFKKTLEIVGTGYRVMARGSDLEFALGFSHPVLIKAPEGITFNVEAPTRFSVLGIDKQQVGEVAANIRKIRKPEPYKGKGVRYAGEKVRRKVGKAGK